MALAAYPPQTSADGAADKCSASMGTLPMMMTRMRYPTSLCWNRLRSSNVWTMKLALPNSKTCSEEQMNSNGDGDGEEEEEESEEDSDDEETYEVANPY